MLIKRRRVMESIRGRRRRVLAAPSPHDPGFRVTLTVRVRALCQQWFTSHLLHDMLVSAYTQAAPQTSMQSESLIGKPVFVPVRIHEFAWSLLPWITGKSRSVVMGGGEEDQHCNSRPQSRGWASGRCRNRLGRQGNYLCILVKMIDIRQLIARMAKMMDRSSLIDAVN